MRYFFSENCCQRLRKILDEIESVKQASLRRCKVAAYYFSLKSKDHADKDQAYQMLQEQNLIFE